MGSQVVNVSDGLSDSFSAGAALIKRAESIAIISHMNPDPDAYGSSCGLALFLKEAFSDKKIVLLNEDAESIGDRLDFVPGAEQTLGSWQDDKAPDLIIICDCGDLSRVGEGIESWVSTQSSEVLNIDHHQSNPLFGVVNIVDTASSSTSELIYELIQHFKGTCISAQVSESLLAGILGDTGGFRYRSTSPRTLEIAARLLEGGAPLSRLAQTLFGSISLAALKLQAFAIENLRVFGNGKIAGAALTEEDYASCSASAFDGDGLVGVLRDIKGIEIAYSMRQVGDMWKTSLRTSSDIYDLSQVASQFGGGGHKAASAFRAKGELKTIQEKLERLLSALITE